MREETRIELQVIREAVLPLLLWYRNLMVSVGLIAGAAGLLFIIVRLVTR
jgi:hypothetical protein